MSSSLRIAIVLSLVFAGSAAAQDDGAPRDKRRAPDSRSAPVVSPAPDALAIRRKREEPATSDREEGEETWPTDDFGRPLRSCDVPWDYVPRH